MRPSERINVHPSTHSPSELTTKTFDVICIGSGWAGRVLAARIVKAGLTALIIENELFGGDCKWLPSDVGAATSSDC
jgi:ribulose 1,5-bisphosphate synthetase/thiazole synthase